MYLISYCTIYYHIVLYLYTVILPHQTIYYAWIESDHGINLQKHDSYLRIFHAYL